MESVEPFNCDIILTANRDNWTPFLIWNPFICSICLVALAKTEHHMNNRGATVEKEQNCLIPDLRGNALKFSPFNILAIDLL